MILASSQRFKGRSLSLNGRPATKLRCRRVLGYLYAPAPHRTVGIAYRAYPSSASSSSIRATVASRCRSASRNSASASSTLGTSIGSLVST